MSGGKGCTCEVKDHKNWVVTRRNQNNSYFEAPKGQAHYSNYSDVRCKKCHALWRCKCKYILELPDGDFK
jgi:hypothetical protein